MRILITFHVIVEIIEGGNVCIAVMSTEDHGMWSHHFMGNRWGNSGNSVILYFGAPKSYSDCSHEIKRRLLLGRKIMTNLDSML